MEKIAVISPSGAVYEVGEPLSENGRFNLYRCYFSDDKTCILKIAASSGENASLDREAYILEIMRDEAKALEDEYSLVKKDTKKLNYQFTFPNLIESFIAKDQDNRRVNVLNFPQIATDLGQLVPISHLISRDRVRVDPRTSAWILGKLLKILVFTHDQNIALNFITGENILINRESHYVAFYDWSKAEVDPVKISDDVTRKEISLVTKAVVLILGGNPNTGELLPDEQLVDNRYADFLSHLIKGGEVSASEAHREFYKLIRLLWPREFYQYTTYKLT